MRKDSIHRWPVVRAAFVVCVLLITIPSCGRKQGEGESRAAASTPDSLLGRCVQLEVTIGDGFTVDGRPVAKAELGEKLLRAYDARNREIAVDVRCGEGVTVAALAELHRAMLARGLHRILYFSGTEDPVPYILPPTQMVEGLAGLPPEAVARVSVAGNALVLDGRTVERADIPRAVRARLAENQDVVFVVAAEANAPYAEFVAVLRDVTAAGAERVAVDLPSGTGG